MTVGSTNLSEKVSVNINISTLAAIDLLVDNGYYSNRSDFINQALREGLQRNQPNIARCSVNAGRRLVAGEWFMGVRVLTCREVDQLLDQGKTISVSGYGLLSIEGDVPPERLYQAVREIKVKGRVRCSPEVKAHYGLGE